MFSGDFIFERSIGRTDFPYSSPEDMKKSLKKIKNLPDNLIVCPGHNYGEVPMRTLGEEKLESPYL